MTHRVECSWMEKYMQKISGAHLRMLRWIYSGETRKDRTVTYLLFFFGKQEINH